MSDARPRRWGFSKLLAVLAIAVAGIAGAWFVLTGQAPKPPPLPENAGKVPQPEYAVTWVPRIGPRQFGNCTRILAIDGGGVRGLVPALILAEIERRTGRPLYRDFDLIVGTSTGSIIALGLTRPSNADARKPAYTAQDVVQLYRDHVARIFPQSFAPVQYLRRIFRPKFGAEQIEAMFASSFEDVRFMEALTNVAVPAYDFEDNRRLWFVSISTAHGNLLMRDIVRGATAAPTYLPPARFAVQNHVSSKGYVAVVDGALFANNPAREALALGQRVRGQGDPSVLLLSIGTGRVAQKHSFDEAWSWGVLGWMDPLLEIAFSDPAIDNQMERELEGHGAYFRMQVDLKKQPVELDDSSPAAVRRLEEATTAMLHAEDSALQRIILELSLPRSPQCGPKFGADYERPEGPRRPAN